MGGSVAPRVARLDRGPSREACAPAVRAVAEHVRSAQLGYDQLAQELAARPGERHELTQSLLRQRAPRAEVGAELRSFDDETAGIEILVPVAQQSVYDAWDALCEAVRASDGEWQEYLRIRPASTQRLLFRALCRRCRRQPGRFS